jgi:hypothetical protein
MSLFKSKEERRVERNIQVRMAFTNSGRHMVAN